MKKIYLLLLILILFCRPADPEFRRKPLKNKEYTGFISRNFFQVVVEVPIGAKEMTMEEERDYCKQRSLGIRDRLALGELIKISVKTEENQKRAGFQVNNNSDDMEETQRDPEIYLQNWKNSNLARGEFQWFLDSLILYVEDYSKPEKCTFVFRNIQEGLFKKVKSTQLVHVPDKRLEDMDDYIDPNIPPGQTTPGTHTGTTGSTDRTTTKKKKKKKK